jgi:hypothetical protein
MYANIIIQLYKCQELFSLLSKRVFFEHPALRKLRVPLIPQACGRLNRAIQEQRLQLLLKKRNGVNGGNSMMGSMMYGPYDGGMWMLAQFLYWMVIIIGVLLLIVWFARQTDDGRADIKYRVLVAPFFSIDSTLTPKEQMTAKTLKSLSSLETFPCPSCVLTISRGFSQRNVYNYIEPGSTRLVRLIATKR